MTSIDAQSRAVPKSLQGLFQNTDVERCVRCQDRVYYAEKVGPVNGVIFHRQCFKCKSCGQHMTMKTYFTNQTDRSDKEIYCFRHAPKGAATGIDARAVGIRQALDAPRLGQSTNEVRSTHAPQYTGEAIGIKQAVLVQSQFQKRNINQHEKHHFPAYIVNKKRDQLFKKQEELEKKQREEEDLLMQRLLAARADEEERIKGNMEQEWEISLKQLTSKFEKDLAHKYGAGSRKLSNTDIKAMTVKMEQEKDNLKRNMTVKMRKEKERMTMRLRKEEQAETALMVEKHSEQMMDLLKHEKDDLKKELEQEIRQVKLENDGTESIDSATELEAALAQINLPSTDQVAPHPPRGRKRDLYYDPSVFNELDEEVFKVAESDNHQTFTDLVRDLTNTCLTDLQKARAIFRWITVKDLNVLDIDEEVDEDTPLSLLRGIKCGTETYHTLFRRLCSYAGLACVEIKGHSKSVGYEPGMKIREETFQNTWNAVLLDGDWWPVQCNWGARHLVLNKDANERPTKAKKQDKIRYQYDEHYFLTDPDEFIQEFFANDPDWQLLERPITLTEFENMPFVRSVFFHYGLEFDRKLESVLHTDDKGGAEVKINVPQEYSQDLVFHYQLRFADRERRQDTEFRGAKLERFVFHSLVDGHALFSVHVPAAASYFLEIFANKIDESNKIGSDPNATMQPFRLKCACKFKIVCEELTGKMHPLPNCASGEWGPSKGRRHFNIKPITHNTGVVSLDGETEIRFKLPRTLHFLCKLRMNNIEDALLEMYVTHQVIDDALSIRIRPPRTGQYGLDIYARPEDAIDNKTLAHACKYLVNCVRVEKEVELPVSKVESSQQMPREKWGPSKLFAELGLKTLSHIDPKIEKADPGNLVIELGMGEPLKLNYHLIREPDEDNSDNVNLKENGKKAKLTLHLHKQGNYLLAIYAKRKKDPDVNMLNVYNYMIRYTADEKANTMTKKKKSFFK